MQDEGYGTEMFFYKKKGGMSMAAGRAQPDVTKVFAAIAMIMSNREDAAKVTLVNVRKKQGEKRSA